MREWKEKMKTTNKYNETATIENVPNPLYPSHVMIEPTTTQVRFEGLTGKSLEYIKQANWASFYTLLYTAQDMITNGTKFEDALTVVIKNESKR